MKSSRIIFAIGVIAAGIIAAMAISTRSGPPAPSASAQNAVTPGRVLAIDVPALQRLMRMDPNLVIIDVRKAAERSGPLGFIPRSLNIPMKKLTAGLEKLPKDKTLVFICHSGPRSLDAARKAAAFGLTSYYVKGGMVAWRRMQRRKGDEKHPAAPSPATPEQGPEETPFFERDMGC
jgi:rhodanese-related sulfurtransferase